MHLVFTTTSEDWPVDGFVVIQKPEPGFTSNKHVVSFVNTYIKPIH